MNHEHEKQQSLEELRTRVAQLEAELDPGRTATWIRSEGDFYPTYFAWAGALLGMFGAFASLLLNVIGSLAVGQNPLKLIQVYLTFPMGEKALGDNLDTGMVLAVGCCLYILTGMVLAIPLHLGLARFYPDASLPQRLLYGTIAGLVLWVVNFYLVLSWLQPLLFGGHWITDPSLMPPWIAAGTHLVFAWVVAALYPWGTLGMNIKGATESERQQINAELPS